MAIGLQFQTKKLVLRREYRVIGVSEVVVLSESLYGGRSICCYRYFEGRCFDSHGGVVGPVYKLVQIPLDGQAFGRTADYINSFILD